MDVLKLIHFKFHFDFSISKASFNRAVPSYQNHFVFFSVLNFSGKAYGR